MTSIVLSPEEIEAITQYKTPTMQLEVLLGLGFVRACIPRKGFGVVLARLHYEAVKNGTYGRKAPEPADDERYRPIPPPLHWRERPEHQERLQRERDARIIEDARRAKLDKECAVAAAACREEMARTRPERRAALVRHHAAKRRVAKLRRTPPWANQDAIRAIYAEAVRLTKETGIEHHVDHTIPLQGELVSGLHVENNLQVLPWRENILKRNRFEVE